LRTWIATAVQTLAIHTSRKSRKTSDAHGRIRPDAGELESISGEAANEANKQERDGKEYSCRERRRVSVGTQVIQFKVQGCVQSSSSKH
jgi:hypothetical protein